MSNLRFLIAVAVCILPLTSPAQSRPDDPLPKLTEVQIASSHDGEKQPVLYWAPDRARTEPTTLFVFLHSWSGDYRQDNSKWYRQAVDRGWIYLHPNFRGVNQSPKACGSRWARQDILDAIDFVVANFQVDSKRIYLAGTSGGGHMAMLMAGHHPNRFSAVSAWVGISDLAAWYRFHLKDGKPQRYAQMTLASLGGAPGSRKEVDAEYRDRSPIHHLHRVGDLPVQICAGINDGHTGSVPIAHSLKAFNVIALSRNDTVISDMTIMGLLHRQSIEAPSQVTAEASRMIGRSIAFTRVSGPTSVVIFEGGHEGLPQPACDWLSRQRHATVSEQ